MSQKPRSQGKGSARRPGKPNAYEDGWERVFGKPKAIDEWVCSICGEPIRPNDFTGTRAVIAGTKAYHNDCRFQHRIVDFP